MLLPCGLVAALSALWMTQFYPPGIDPPANFDGPFLYAIRLLAASAMAWSLCLGFAAVRRRDDTLHGSGLAHQPCGGRVARFA